MTRAGLLFACVGALFFFSALCGAFEVLNFWRWQYQLVFMAVPTPKFLVLLHLNISMDSQILILPDGEPDVCPFGVARHMNQSTFRTRYGKNMVCLFDNKISTPFHYFTMQAIFCEYPPMHLSEGLRGKTVSIQVNGETVYSTATYEGPYQPPCPTESPGRAALEDRERASPSSETVVAKSSATSSQGMGKLHSQMAAVSNLLPQDVPGLGPGTQAVAPKKRYFLCACLVMWYRTEFLKNWLQYHTSLGLEYTQIYDNDSGLDQLEDMVNLLSGEYNIRRIAWNYWRIQYAGYDHCMLELKDQCQWVMVTDIDEYLNIGKEYTLRSILEKNTNSFAIQMGSYSYVPGEHLDVSPTGGFLKNYRCRLTEPSNRKNIIQPHLIHPSGYHVIHYFCGAPGTPIPEPTYALEEIHLNHYEFPSWPVYKRKYIKRASVTKLTDETYDEDLFKQRYIEKVSGCPVEDRSLEYFYYCRFTLKEAPGCEFESSNVQNTLITGVNDGGLAILKKLFFHEKFKPDAGVHIEVQWREGVSSAQAFDYQIASFHKVIHIVEHPLRAISSIAREYTDKDWAYVYTKTPLVKASMEATLRALYHWVTWNLHIDTYADVRFIVTKSNLHDICTECGYSPSTCKGIPEKVKSKCQDHRYPSWQSLEELDPYVAGLAKNMTLRYGLDLEFECSNS